MNFRPYHTQREIADDFGLNHKTVAARLKELRQMSDRYGTRAVIDDGNLVLVFLPAFTDYMANRRKLLDKNLAKFADPYDPKEVIRELGMDAWDNVPTEHEKAEIIDENAIRRLIKKVLLEGLNEKRAV